MNETTKRVLPKNFFSKDYFGDESLIDYIKKLLLGEKKSNYFDYQSLADSFKFWKPVIEILKEYGIEGEILDLGCAFGLLEKHLPLYFKKVYGLDVSAYAIEQARLNAALAEFMIASLNAKELPFKDKTFRCVIALEVLEHTDSVEESLKKIISIMKDDGILIISLPARGTFWGKVFQLFDIDKSHISAPKSQKEILDIIDRVGLKVVKKNCGMLTPFGEIKGIAISVQLVLQKK